MRELGFFATIFGRNRGVKQCLLDNVTVACEENHSAATRLEEVITARLASSQHERDIRNRTRPHPTKHRARKPRPC